MAGVVGLKINETVAVGMLVGEKAERLIHARQLGELIIPDDAGKNSESACSVGLLVEQQIAPRKIRGGQIGFPDKIIPANPDGQIELLIKSIEIGVFIKHVFIRFVGDLKSENGVGGSDGHLDASPWGEKEISNRIGGG